jgi:uncharacterized protein YmfQ (DUF2313 family)
MTLPQTVASRIPAAADEVERRLPPGPAWLFRDGSLARRLLEAAAVPLAWLEERILRLLEESDPRTTVELLPDFERVYGLPDSCAPTATSLVARRAAVVRKINAPVGHTNEAIASVVHAFGLPCTVESHRVAAAGLAEIGDELTDEAWANSLTVHLPDPPVVWFEADWSGAGDPLAEYVGEQLECAVERVAPAHLVLVFQYDEPIGDYQPWQPLELNVEPAELASSVGVPELEA